MLYVYFLLLNSGEICKGVTTNLRRRINEHKLGKVRSTKNKKHLKFIYCEAYSLYVNS